ncbi:hemicentin-1 isoform X3 [Lutzomyia longipalpis]|uniref:hemicentin-1 isoform X3 n=1 Tax=Lutzomyia longipalpis TaxID=7200 RepID=UPI00248467CE|nr:hemicentin-1 isoform X3 [Lutzomyia longipalpis]
MEKVHKFYQWNIGGKTLIRHFLVYILCMIGMCPLRIHCNGSQDFQKHIPTRLVWAAVDHDAELPCDVASSTPRDSAKLVLWFKDSTGIPIYSLDSRGGGPFESATHSALASDLGNRLYFSSGTRPHDAKLQIRGVKSTDEGVYRCRVDFFNSPTRNFRVNLTLVVPPEEPKIFDAQGKEVTGGVAGPFREGHELFLSCQVSGGRPPPKVTWWRNSEEISGISHPSADIQTTTVVNQLFIGNITREFLGTRLQCRAQGSKLIPPVVKEFAIQVHLKPLAVKIVTANELLRAGQTIPLRCEAWGSHPPAKIVWLLDGEPIRNPNLTICSDRDDGNFTCSILPLRVIAEYDGAELTCRATNPWFSAGTLQDKRIIHVAYPPIVSIHLANEDPSRLVIRSEGQNVTLKCRANARPSVTSFGWYKNGMRMTGESSETLHLMMLERESEGSYSCSALNIEGETQSTPLVIQVQYSPRCKPGTEQISLGALNLHTISVKCEVDADPADSVRFSWTYNNTRNVSPVLNSRINSHGLVSSMTYMPQSDSEFITLACWASNSVGRQTIPCLIHIFPARTPDPPRLCELYNNTHLEVVCIAGNDGGLEQHFLLEVINGEDIHGRAFSTLPDAENEISTMNDQATSAPLLRLKEDKPLFKLDNLEHGREYQLLVYAVNAKGRSYPPVVLDKVRISNLNLLYDETIVSDDLSSPPANDGSEKRESTLIILVAIVGSGIIIVISIVIAAIAITYHHMRPKPPQPQDVRKRMRPARTDVPSMYSSEEVLEEEVTGSTAIRPHHASISRSSRYISEGFVQYSQPSLNNGKEFNTTQGVHDSDISVGCLASNTNCATNSTI